MYLLEMPISNKYHKYILCIIDKVTNYLITVPIHESKSEETGDVLKENAITKYYVPEYIIMDQDSTFMSSLMNYLFNKFDIKIKMVAINHYRQNMELNFYQQFYKKFDKLRSDVAKNTCHWLHFGTMHSIPQT